MKIYVNVNCNECAWWNMSICFNGDIIMLMLHTVKSVLYENIQLPFICIHVYCTSFSYLRYCANYQFVWKKACLINQQMINIFKLILNTHVYNIMLDILTCICVAYNYQRDWLNIKQIESIYLYV